MRRIGQKNSSFYIAGQSAFTDGLIIVALLLAFVLVFIIGYCVGSWRKRRVADIAPQSVTQTSTGRDGGANGDDNDGDRQVNDGDGAQGAVVWSLPQHSNSIDNIGHARFECYFL